MGRNIYNYHGKGHTPKTKPYKEHGHIFKKQKKPLHPLGRAAHHRPVTADRCEGARGVASAKAEAASAGPGSGCGVDGVPVIQARLRQKQPHFLLYIYI